MEVLGRSRSGTILQPRCQTLRVSVLGTQAASSETSRVLIGSSIGLCLSRLNQSIEAPVYCALGAQVNVQSSILGNGGRAKEAQSEFLASLEGSTRQTDLSKSVRRYQLPIDEGKLRLDLAAAPRAWLMPFRMVINTERTDAYNNKLKQATPNMELGLTNDVNKETQQ